MKTWFVLYVKSGEELNILKRLLPSFEAFVPMRTEILRKEGVTKYETKPLFTGYIFIRLGQLCESYYAIKDIPAVYKFLGEISDKEVEVFYEISKRAKISKVRFVEDKIVAIEGALKGLEDKIIKVDKRKKKAKVSLEVQGQIKEVDFAYTIVNTE